jgi:hypothetical protein
LQSITQPLGYASAFAAGTIYRCPEPASQIVPFSREFRMMA